MDIETNKEQLDQRIKLSASQAGKEASAIRMLAVSKTRSPQTIRALASLGQRSFGENYLQEALDKINSLADLELEWHFIGQIQRNKTTAIAENFSWVHSIDRYVIAERLSAQRPQNLGKLNVCIQVSMSEEEGKGGVQPDDAASLAQSISKLPGLTFRGVMTIPENTTNPDKKKETFRNMFALFKKLQAQHVTVDTLSMGMSGDFEMAIEEGSTMIRVGTALFGPRKS